jgi:hypothetical protein
MKVGREKVENLNDIGSKRKDKGKIHVEEQKKCRRGQNKGCKSA